MQLVCRNLTEELEQRRKSLYISRNALLNSGSFEGKRNLLINNALNGSTTSLLQSLNQQNSSLYKQNSHSEQELSGSISGESSLMINKGESTTSLPFEYSFSGSSLFPTGSNNSKLSYTQLSQSETETCITIIPDTFIRWKRQVEHISKKLVEMKKEVERLALLYQQVELSKATEEQQSCIREQCSVESENIQKLFYECENEIQHLSTSSFPTSKSGRIVSENARRGYASILYDLFVTFKLLKSNHEEYLHKQQLRIKQLHDNINAVFPTNESTKLVNSLDPLYHVTLIQNEEIDRTQEIVSLQQSINELQTLFSSLHLLTFEQADLVERIDHNISQTVNSNHAVIEELERTISRTASKLTFRKFIFLLLLGIIGIIIYIYS